VGGRRKRGKRPKDSGRLVSSSKMPERGEVEELKGKGQNDPKGAKTLKKGAGGHQTRPKASEGQRRQIPAHTPARRQQRTSDHPGLQGGAT